MTTDELLEALIAADTPPRLVIEIARRLSQLDLDNERRARNAERMSNVRARARTVQHSAAPQTEDN
jgi:hypothetical protein